MVVPPYPRGICFKISSRCLKLEIVPQLSYVFFLYIHTFSLKGSIYSFSLAYPNFYHHYSCTLEPLLSPGYLNTSNVTVHLVTKTTTE